MVCVFWLRSVIATATSRSSDNLLLLLFKLARTVSFLLTLFLSDLIHSCFLFVLLSLSAFSPPLSCRSFAPCVGQRGEGGVILNVYKRNICGAERCPWGGTVRDGYLDHTGRGLLTSEQLYFDGAALSHFLCLDMNGKERNQLVVNTGASMPAPSPLFTP